jgi:hypothetical protein
MTAED